MANNTIPKRDSFTSQDKVDAFFKYVGKREGLARAAVEAVEEFRQKKKISAKYEHLLDVGCGNGSTTVEFLKYFPLVSAIDISELQIEKAKEAYGDGEITPKFLVAPGEKIPLEDSTIDVIVSIFGLQYFRMDEFFAECRRILKPSGVIILVGALPGDFVPRTETIAPSPSDENLIRRMLDDLTLYAEEINNIQKHVLDRFFKLYQQIQGFKKSRDDSKECYVEMSLQGFKDLWYSIQFFALPKCKDITDTFLEDLKKLWGLGHLQDREVEITIRNEISIISLSKI